VKRILFVDDDAQLHEAVRSRLRSRASEWDLSFVASAERALDELERVPSDVIVSDVRLPGMDGAQFLRRVNERWPGAVRIALSAPADLAGAMRLLPLAHQYLSKPCPSQHLEHVIERCLKLQDLLSRPALRALIGRVRQLPAQPRIFARLQVVMANENVTPREIGRIISADAVITAKVLQIANSAFFRRARRVTNVEQAVLYLGFASVRNLAMCAEVFARWPGKLAHGALDLDLLQQHAQRVAAVAQALTARTVWSDDSVLAALLHDIGYWVLIQECPRELDRAIEMAIKEGIAVEDAEQRVMGASHAEVGAYLLGLWGLPYPVIEAVAHHHLPERAGAQRFDVVAALAVAVALSGTDDTDAFHSAPPRSALVGPDFLVRLKAPFGWSQAEERAVDCLAALERAAS